MSSQSSGAPEKGEIHTEPPQPIDLAPRAPNVQLRPVRAFGRLPHTNISAKGGSSQIASAVGAQSIISVNRSAPNVTLLTRGAHPQTISTHYITRVARPGAINIATGNQPTGSITVTPITASSVRLSGGTVNNGSYIGVNSVQSPFPTQLRAIAVSGRPVRPSDGKVLVPQQHVTQLQMVDSKGSLLKPQIATTPIMNLRGTLHSQGNSNSGPSVSLPIPFSIRTNLPTIQRPQSSSTNANAVQKVQITPATPIQFVNANKSPHVIQTGTALPRLSTVCLTISSSAAIAPNNTSSAVVAASKQVPSSSTSLVMTPSQIGAGATGNAVPMKVFPVGRDQAAVLDLGSGTRTISVTSMQVTNAATSHTAVPLSTSSLSMTMAITAPVSSVAHGQSQIVQVHGPVIQGAHVGVPVSSSTPYIIDKGIGILPGPPQSTQLRPISYEKRGEVKSLPTGSMIITAQHPTTIPSSGICQGGQTMTIPLAPHGATAVTLAQSISISHHQTILGTSSHGSQIFGSGHISGVATNSPITITGVHQGTVGSSHILSGSQNSPLITSLGSSNVTSSSIISNVNNTSNSGNNSSSNSLSAGLASSTTNLGSQFSSSSVINSSANLSVVNNNISGNNLTFSSSACNNSVSNGVPSSAALASTVAAAPPNTKTTHSPRPSILRKREVIDSHPPARAQRNLSLTFNYVNNSTLGSTAVSNTNGGNTTSKTCVVNANVSSGSTTSGIVFATGGKDYDAPTKTICSNAVGVSNSVGQTCGNSLMSNSLVVNVNPPSVPSNIPPSSSASSCVPLGISILKKEFQPPNEESSWQSCGSNSSSGSTTISATSETAEIQLQNSSLDLAQAIRDIPNNCISIDCGIESNSTPEHGLLSRVTGSGSQNGIVRQLSSSLQSGKGQKGYLGKIHSKDIERIKNSEKDRDDHVSPRKKPRKQQLQTTSDFIESAPPEFSFFQGKKVKKPELNRTQLDEFNERLGFEPIQDEPPPVRYMYHILKPHMSMMKHNKLVNPKPRLNHFERYCDVKAKEEKSISLQETCNQKNVYQRLGGTKIEMTEEQMDLVNHAQSDFIDRLKKSLNRLESGFSNHASDRDLNQILELLKGNLQRCKVVREQVSEARTNISKLIDHKPLVLDIVNKYNTNKRPSKKKTCIQIS